jgi:hypothetical protein
MKIPFAFIEPLESRIAPASFVFVDVDGDHVRVTSSTPSIDISTTPSGLGVQITHIDVTGGTNVNISVSVFAKGPQGDGLVNVGEITADPNVTLGKISVAGDLGRISASGNGTLTDTVIKSVNVRSLGDFGTATGAPANGNGTVQCVIGGGLGSLKVRDDVNGLLIENLGSIGSISIGRSLIGGLTISSGEILCSGALGPVKIGGSIIGGAETDAGSIIGQAGIKSITVAGSVVGGSAPESGYILNNSSDQMGPVKIAGNLEGGQQSFSGTVNSFGNLGPVSIGGSIFGGADDSGSVFMQLAGGTMTSVKVHGNVIGGYNATASAEIGGAGSIGSVTIGGSLVGGGSSTDTDSGAFEAGGNIGTVKIGGDLQIGKGLDCGFVEAGGTLGSLIVKGWNTGFIEITGNTGSLSLGSYFSGSFESASGGVKSVSVAGDLTGGNVSQVAGNIGSIYIGGSISNITGIGSTGGSIGSLVVKGSVETGSLFSSWLNFGSAKIAGSFNGQIGSDIGSVGSVSVRGDAVDAVVIATEGSIGSVKIGGTVTSSEFLAGLANLPNTAVKIGSITVGGDWIASSVSAGFEDVSHNGYGNDDDALIAMSGTIGSIVIGGQVIGTVSPTNDHFGFDAQSITLFKMGGNTIAVGSTPEDITLSYATGADVAIHISPV